MSRFYLFEYDVQDYTAYIGFAQSNLLAKYGSHSLCMLIMKSGFRYYNILHIVCLLGLAFAMFSFVYFLKYIFNPEIEIFLLANAGMISFGIGYYFYEKTVYDFPFTIATYGTCVIVTIENIAFYYQLY